MHKNIGLINTLIKEITALSRSRKCLEIFALIDELREEALYI